MTALRDFGEPERLRPLGISVDATGTRYEGWPDHPISYRSEAGYSLDWCGLAAKDRARELEHVGVEILAAGVHEDPDVRYVKAVVEAILDNMAERSQGAGCEHAPRYEEIDTIRCAMSAAIDDAAEVVARRWLRERGSVPLLAHQESPA